MFEACRQVAVPSREKICIVVLLARDVATFWRDACGTDRRPLPGAPADTSESPGRPRDGTPGKIRGTDRRPLPGAPSDTSEGPAGLGTERPANPAGRIKGHFRAPLRIQVRAPAGLGTERRAKPAGRIQGEFRAPLLIQVRAPAGLGTERRAKPAGRIQGEFRAPLLIQVRGSAGFARRVLCPKKGPVRGCCAKHTTPIGPKKCSRLPAISLTQATGSPLLSVPAGAAPSPEHRLVEHKQQEPTCCPRAVRPCGSGEHRS